MADDNAQTKPWGDDADFDAAKAWTLIQALRGDKTKLQTDLDSERQAREAADEKVADAEKKLADADPEGKRAAAEKRAAEAERKLTIANVIGDFPTLKGFEDFLTGTTPEELKASAERLSALGKPAGDDEGKGSKPGDEGKSPKPGSGPEPQLRPGHGGEQTPTFDPDAIATAARR